MKELIEMIEVWKENPEDMQKSYPYGLGQYLQESLEDKDALLSFVCAVVDNPYIEISFSKEYGILIGTQLD